MATDKQFSFFKSLYDEESQRTSELHEHAKNNLTLVTFFSAFVLFVIEKRPPTSVLATIVFVIAVVMLVGAFLLSLWATKISVFEAINEPADILEQYEHKLPNDEEFMEDRIVDYTVAYERNSIVNDRKANELSVARYLLLAGIVAQSSYILVIICQQGGK